eukprot:scaffold130967_cov21-Tisochrysis_lutea.AAC.1
MNHTRKDVFSTWICHLSCLASGSKQDGEYMSSDRFCARCCAGLPATVDQDGIQDSKHAAKEPSGAFDLPPHAQPLPQQQQQQQQQQEQEQHRGNQQHRHRYHQSHAQDQQQQGGKHHRFNTLQESKSSPVSGTGPQAKPVAAKNRCEVVVSTSCPNTLRESKASLVSGTVPPAQPVAAKNRRKVTTGFSSSAQI